MLKLWKAIFVLSISVTALLTPQAWTETAPAPADVVVAGRIVARFRVGSGKMTPQQRVEVIEKRIVQIYSEPGLALKPVTVKVEKQKNKSKTPPQQGQGEIQATLWVGDSLLLTITTVDAAANHTTPSGLAMVWQKNFAEALPQGIPTFQEPSPTSGEAQTGQ